MPSKLLIFPIALCLHSRTSTKRLDKNIELDFIINTESPYTWVGRDYIPFFYQAKNTTNSNAEEGNNRRLLSFGRLNGQEWCGRRDLNPGSQAYKAYAGISQ